MYIYTLVICDLFIIYFIYFIIFINLPIKKIIYNLFYIDLSFFIGLIIYNYHFNHILNTNYDKYLNRIIKFNDYFNYKVDGILQSYKFKNIFGLKYLLTFNILNKNGLVISYDIYNYNTVKFNKSYYYSYLLYLLNKYNSNFKRLDFYITNYIKDFLY